VSAASPQPERDGEPTLLPRGPRALPRDVVETVHRRRLLTAMAQAVADKGYAATSIADIVARARVSRSAFYQCFADKEDCFLSAYSQEVDRHFSVIAAAAEQEADWLGQFEAGVRAYVRELELHPRFARSFLIEIVAAGPRASELRTAVHERYAAFMKSWYESAPAATALPKLPDEIFRAAVGASNELVIARFERTGSDPDQPPPAGQPLEDLVLHSLLALFGLSGVKPGPGAATR
jgi:AcrR family transcriptional regulator